jgi:cytochrome c peroxidase
MAVQPGGPDMRHRGFRNTPSLTYLHSPVAFTEHFMEHEVTGVEEDEGPTGGRTWDGRVDSASRQALMPLLDPNEMANTDIAALAARVARTPYADAFRRLFSSPGQDVFQHPDEVAGWAGVALEMFEQTPAEFHPFTSKYDAYLHDAARLSAPEKRGLALFNDPGKGNCASCHPGTVKGRNERPLFTDFGHVALGVPRNRQLDANRDPSFHDLGLCGPLRQDLADRTHFCGAFRTPSLRNVALRKRYFHNGVFSSLRDVVAFYATRETNPARWYPRGPDGHAARYDDLSREYWPNVNNEVPFKPLPGNRPRLDERDIRDLVSFLKTLSDGYIKKTGPR